MVLRYLLETCETPAQALAALDRLPVALAQNVTVVDRDGHAATVYTGPDIPATRAPDACAANHQHLPVPPEQDADTHTLARLAAVRAAAGDARPDAVLAALLRPPLHQTRYDAGLGTVYTAVYRPAEGRLTYHWPGQDPWEHTLAAFRPGTREVALPPAAVTA
jgi:predicted choloylglycine hydrolase